MFKRVIYLITCILISGSAHAIDLEMFIPEEITHEEVWSLSGEKRSFSFYPIRYDYLTYEGTSAHVHTYVDSYVITIATGHDKGLQAIYDLNNNLLVSKQNKDYTKKVNGIKYDVYDYGTILIYQNNNQQFGYVK